MQKPERNVIAKRPDLDRAAVSRRFSAMTRAMPEAMLDPPPAKLVDAMTNHEGDRHLLAAAVSAQAETVVTETTSHFPRSACEPYGIENRTLDEFVTDLVLLSATDVWAAIQAMTSPQTNPPQTIAAIFELLERHIPAALPNQRIHPAPSSRGGHYNYRSQADRQTGVRQT